METATTTIMVPGPDGRELCVESGGDPHGRAVLVHDGTPNSRHLYPPLLADAERDGIRLLSYDRPGYGRSTAQPGRSVADCANDVRAIASALGIHRMGVWGISGGGPHALACAALLPDLVCAVGSLASIAPYGVPGLDFFSGMGADNLDDITLFLSDPVAARKKSRQDRDEFLEVTPEQLAASWATLLSGADLAALNDDLAEYMVSSMKDGLEPGDQGWWDDACADMADWGFGFADISVPVQLWHGEQDRFVPFQHGQWLAAQIPGVEAHLTQADGHLTLLDHVPEVHEWLLERF
jgi:pimeloyl-ACP methyl ester carboxylesterase